MKAKAEQNSKGIATLNVSVDNLRTEMKKNHEGMKKNREETKKIQEAMRAGINALLRGTPAANFRLPLCLFEPSAATTTRKTETTMMKQRMWPLHFDRSTGTGNGKGTDTITTYNIISIRHNENEKQRSYCSYLL